MDECEKLVFDVIGIHGDDGKVVKALALHQWVEFDSVVNTINLRD